MTRFYCPECGMFRDRREVNSEGDYGDTYYCRKCKSAVMQSKYVEEEMLKDYMEYLISKGREGEFY